MSFFLISCTVPGTPSSPEETKEVITPMAISEIVTPIIPDATVSPISPVVSPVDTPTNTIDTSSQSK